MADQTDGIYQITHKHVTTAEMLLLQSPPLGMRVFNTTTEEVMYRVTGGWYCTRTRQIGTGSLATIPISTDPVNPSYLTGFQPSTFDGFVIDDPATGAFKNTSGRLIESLTGTISMFIAEQGGGDVTVDFYSERSTDGGATWTITPISLRSVVIENGGSSFITKASFISNVQPDELFRFAVDASGVGGASIEPLTATKQGVTVQTPSITFELTEQFTIIKDTP